ncbi:MAG TPA: S46 family peptidase, partial [Holophaga sp.]|nr:S46 family peptidase [Holophaga sp.]
MRTLLRSSLLLLLAAGTLRSDEGMWTFDNVPLQKMKAAHGFAPDAAWLKKAQLATLRFPGGTGAFVSRDGLVITNHHVGRSAIAQVSSAQRDFIKDGFTAATRDQEIKVPGLELMMLVSSEDVTARVNGAVKPGMAEAAALKARQNALSELRKAEEGRTGLTCEPVTLYQGGEYWIYRYKKFSDVRLAAAPEVQVASFGGDADNYTYPRWDLDFALFRVYENGKPYA